MPKVNITCANTVHHRLDAQTEGKVSVMPK